MLSPSQLISVMLVVCSTACAASETNSTRALSQPLYLCSITNASGIFNIELWSAENTSGMFSLVVESCGADSNKSVHIKDEAMALDKFFNIAPQLKYPASHLKFIYIPEMHESEVLERLNERVNAGGKVGNGTQGKVFEDYLLNKHAYRELEEVLKAHGLTIERIDVENVSVSDAFSLTGKRSKANALPFYMATHLMLKSIVADK